MGCVGSSRGRLPAGGRRRRAHTRRGAASPRGAEPARPCPAIRTRGRWAPALPAGGPSRRAGGRSAGRGGRRRRRGAAGSRGPGAVRRPERLPALRGAPGTSSGHLSKCRALPGAGAGLGVPPGPGNTAAAGHKRPAGPRCRSGWAQPPLQGAPGLGWSGRSVSSQRSEATQLTPLPG